MPFFHSHIHPFSLIKFFTSVLKLPCPNEFVQAGFRAGVLNSSIHARLNDNVGQAL
jgi:hypothetical protein